MLLFRTERIEISLILAESLWPSLPLPEAVKGRCLKSGEIHPHAQEPARSLIDLYEARGKPEET